MFVKDFIRPKIGSVCNISWSSTAALLIDTWKTKSTKWNQCNQVSTFECRSILHLPAFEYDWDLCYKLKTKSNSIILWDVSEFLFWHPLAIFAPEYEDLCQNLHSIIERINRIWKVMKLGQFVRTRKMWRNRLDWPSRMKGWRSREGRDQWPMPMLGALDNIWKRQVSGR